MTQAPAGTRAETVRRRGGLRVLVADGHADAAESTALLLRECGHDVAVAGDGASAVAMAALEAPDVVVLDLGVGRLDGFEVARRLTAAGGRNGPRIVAVTAYLRADDRRRAEEAGIVPPLVKPVDPEALVAVIDRFRRTRCGVIERAG